MEYTLEKGARRYCMENRQLYLEMGKAIEPDRDDWRQVWDRVAFAILSANAPFESAARALKFMAWRRDGDLAITDDRILSLCKGITKRRFRYVECLRHELAVYAYARDPEKSWHDYRMYLQESVMGLGLSKASFAACLLYPTIADLACVDVHIHRLFTGIQKAPNRIKLSTYQAIEDSIRRIGIDTRLPPFLCQWAIWDFARGKVEDHQIWPQY